MRRIVNCTLVSSIFLLITPALGLAGTLKAGTACVDITPPLGLSMYGYAGRKGSAAGIRDPLYAHVLVLEADERRLALVSLDLGRVFGPAWIERLRAHAKNKLGISYVLIAATHTHSGPAIRDEYPAKESPDWETPVLEKVERALEDAQKNAVAAQLGVGYGVAYVGHNRLRVNPDGTVTWFQRNLTKVATAPIDPTVTVLRVDNLQRHPVAILVNYACHPVVFGPDNLEYSADYPGVMAASVAQAFSRGSAVGSPTVMFVQGGDGDINPYYAVTPLEQDAEKLRDWTGESLAREVVRVANEIRTEPASDARLEFAEDVLDFNLRWDLDKLRERVLKSRGPQAAESFDRRRRKGLHLPVAVVLINRRVALMTMPGEPFVEFQQAWRRQCPVRDCLFLGYANGSFGYFPTLRAASLGGYGAANSATYIEVGAGERMVDHALVRLYEMLGRLTDVPEDLSKK